MGAAGTVSAGASALQGFGKIEQGITSADQQMQAGEQTSEADQFQAQKLENAAYAGWTQAQQTDQALRLQTRQLLGNMMAVRASANTSASSPTGAAIMLRTQGQSDQERGITVGNINAQAREDQSESLMYTQNANEVLQAAYSNSQSSLLGGFLGGGASLLSGISGLIPK